MIPLWALYGLGAAFCVVFLLLAQEKHKVDGFALAFWIKFFVVIYTAPFVIQNGLPDSPLFYVLMVATAILYCISDVIYFRAIPQIGSGIVTRTMPIAVVLSFIIWLFFDPELITEYASKPYQTAGIIGSILLAAVSASFLKRCSVSWQAIKTIWFCIFAACVGPTANKLSLDSTSIQQGPYAFVVVQGLFMLIFWSIYYSLRKPIPSTVLFSRHSIQAGALLGIFSMVMMIFKMKSVALAENPAYVSILMYTDALWIILAYKLIGKKETSNIWAGIGIVISAALLIIFKSI